MSLHLSPTRLRHVLKCILFESICSELTVRTAYSSSLTIKASFNPALFEHCFIVVAGGLCLSTCYKPSEPYFSHFITINNMILELDCLVYNFYLYFIHHNKYSLHQHYVFQRVYFDNVAKC